MLLPFPLLLALFVSHEIHRGLHHEGAAATMSLGALVYPLAMCARDTAIGSSAVESLYTIIGCGFGSTTIPTMSSIYLDRLGRCRISETGSTTRGWAPMTPASTVQATVALGKGVSRAPTPTALAIWCSTSRGTALESPTSSHQHVVVGGARRGNSGVEKCRVDQTAIKSSNRLVLVRSH